MDGFRDTPLGVAHMYLSFMDVELRFAYLLYLFYTHLAFVY